jgi:hypothetical protein
MGQPLRTDAAVMITLEDIRRIMLAFPGVTEGVSYGTPAFRARKQFLARMHDHEDALVLKVGEFEQQMLMETEPEVYFITDHYRGTSLILVRLKEIDAAAFRRLFEQAWQKVAGKRDLAAYQAANAAPEEDINA